jgi:uncharacterized membrane protein YqaE (UPF0057 family)
MPRTKLGKWAKDRSFLVILATILGFLATLLYAAWVADFVFS